MPLQKFGRRKFCRRIAAERGGHCLPANDRVKNGGLYMENHCCPVKFPDSNVNVYLLKYHKGHMCVVFTIDL